MDTFIFGGTQLDIVEYPNGELALKNSTNDIDSIIKNTQNLGNNVSLVLDWKNCTVNGLIILKTLSRRFK